MQCHTYELFIVTRKMADRAKYVLVLDNAKEVFVNKGGGLVVGGG